MGLEVNTLLKKYIDDQIALSNAYTDAQIAAHIHVMIKTGTYVGNGIDNRDIDIGVNLAAKSNVWVIVKQNGGSAAKHHFEYGQGDLSMDFGAGTDLADVIQTFTATGFQVGVSSYVNTNTILYRYIAFWEEP